MSPSVGSFSGKQPAEKFYYKLDFGNDLRGFPGTLPGDTISSVLFTVVDDAGRDVTAQMYDSTRTIIEGSSVYVFLQGGISGMTYKCSALITMSPSGQKAELDVFLPVIAV